MEYERGLESASRRVREALLSLSGEHSSFLQALHWRNRPLACTLEAAVHETTTHLTTGSGRYNLQLAIAFYSQATTKTSSCNHYRLQSYIAGRRRRNKQS